MEHLETIGAAYSQVYRKYATPFDVVVPEYGHLEWLVLETPVFPLLLAAHALFAANAVHALTGGTQHWLKSLVLTFCVSFGGSTLACVLAGFPTPLSTTEAGDQIAVALLSAWWLINQVPAFRMVYRTPVVSLVARPVAALAKCRAIFGFVDRMAKARPGAVAAAVVLGGLSGSGGSLFVSLENKWRHGPHIPSELSRPRWGSKSAVLTAVVYYVATDPAGVLGTPVDLVGKRDAAVGIAVFMMVQAGMEVILQREFSPMYYLEEIACALLRLHAPSSSFSNSISNSSARSCAEPQIAPVVTASADCASKPKPRSTVPTTKSPKPAASAPTATTAAARNAGSSKKARKAKKKN